MHAGVRMDRSYDSASAKCAAKTPGRNVARGNLYPVSRWGIAIGLGCMLVASGCNRNDAFVCGSDSECSSDDGEGTCQPTGYCSFPDDACVSGQRYGDLARDDLARLCVPPGESETESATAGSNDVCGDAVRTGDEICDAAALGDNTCSSVGFVGGALSCTADCVFDTSFCNSCGNGQIDAGEQCDGSNLGDAVSCADLGLGETDESLSCTNTCMYSFAECSGCGDGVVVSPELCEPGRPREGGCEERGFDGGALQCTDGCTFDTSGCFTCGNGVVEGSEPCDGADLGGATCTSEGFSGSGLQCTAACELDTSECGTCGDGLAQTGEECDQLDVGGATCESLGFNGGELKCDMACNLDTSGCTGTGCGNDTIEGEEECDGDDLGSATCASAGFDGGSLSCSSCALDTSNCYTCGDNVAQADEACDGPDLGDASCVSLGFGGGSLSCNANCTHNTTLCFDAAPDCGNGIIDPGEDCDGSNVGGLSCEDVDDFFVRGTLSCNEDCTFNTNSCKFD